MSQGLIPTQNYTFNPLTDGNLGGAYSHSDRSPTPGGGSSMNQNEVEVEDEENDDGDDDIEYDEEDDFVVQPTQQTFTQLLSQQPASQSTPQPKLSQNRGQGAVNWCIVENDWLVSAYMNTSVDSIRGAKQKKKEFWSKVLAKYDESRLSNPGNMPERTLSSLKSRWLRLAADIMKWVGCYDEALRRKTSGQNENDVLHEAHVIYENSFGGRFLSIECWKELVKFPKWKPIIKESLNQPRGRPSTCGNVESQGSGSSGKRSREEFEGEGTPTSGYGGSNRGRAMGTKAAKSRLKSTAEAISTFESFSE